MQTDASGHYHEAGIAPHLILPSFIDEVHRAAAERLPPSLAEPMTLAQGLFFQTIVDLEVPRMVQGRVAMLGDSAYSARPHTGMGVVKATGDANCLTQAIEANPGDLAAALAIYDEERTRYGRSLVRFGRQLGTHIETPERSAEDRALGDYLREPLPVIQAISVPPPLLAACGVQGGPGDRLRAALERSRLERFRFARKRSRSLSLTAAGLRPARPSKDVHTPGARARLARQPS